MESLPIDARLEQERLGLPLPDLGIQFTINSDVNLFCAMGTLRLKFNGKLFSPEAPLHEGRNESIFRSRAMGAFTGAEFQMMRRPIRSDRKSPADFSLVVANQEKEMAFQLIDNGIDSCKR